MTESFACWGDSCCCCCCHMLPGFSFNGLGGEEDISAGTCCNALTSVNGSLVCIKVSRVEKPSSDLDELMKSMAGDSGTSGSSKLGGEDWGNCANDGPGNWLDLIEEHSTFTATALIAAPTTGSAIDAADDDVEAPELDLTTTTIPVVAAAHPLHPTHGLARPSNDCT